MIRLTLCQRRLPVALLIAVLSGCATTSVDSTGSPRMWAGPEAGLSQPIDLVQHPGSGWLVVDSGNNRLVHVDAEGRTLDRWGSRGTAPGRFRRPLGVAVGSDHRVYVADYLNDRVQVLDATGRPLAQWTGFGENDRFNGPADVTADGQGHVYVLELNGSRVIKLDREGHVIRTWGGRGHGRDQFYYPTRITMGPKQRLWVTDAYNHQLKVYSADGELVHVIGGKGEKPGRFNVPGGVAFDHAGGFWVADFFNSRLQHFADASGGEPRITVWTGRNSRVGPLHYPTDVTLSRDDHMLFLVDHGNDRIVVLAVDPQEGSP